MNSVLKNAFIFTFGACAGAAAAWFILRTKYAQIAQEEIDSVKAMFARREAKKDEQKKEESVPEVVEPKKEETDETQGAAYKEKLLEEKYLSDSDDGPDSKDIGDKPYVISPDEFGEFAAYERISLTYYADEVLADDMDELVEDVDKVVGYDSLSRFGEYEEDIVHVRNDRLKCDYEITKDSRTYVVVAGKNPSRRVEV